MTNGTAAATDIDTNADPLAGMGYSANPAIIAKQVNDVINPNPFSLVDINIANLANASPADRCQKFNEQLDLLITALRSGLEQRNPSYDPQELQEMQSAYDKLVPLRAIATENLCTAVYNVVNWNNSLEEISQRLNDDGYIYRVLGRAESPAEMRHRLDSWLYYEKDILESLQLNIGPDLQSVMLREVSSANTALAVQLTDAQRELRDAQRRGASPQDIAILNRSITELNQAASQLAILLRNQVNHIDSLQTNIEDRINTMSSVADPNELLKGKKPLPEQQRDYEAFEAQVLTVNDATQVHFRHLKALGLSIDDVYTIEADGTIKVDTTKYKEAVKSYEERLNEFHSHGVDVSKAREIINYWSSQIADENLRNLESTLRKDFEEVLKYFDEKQRIQKGALEKWDDKYKNDYATWKAQHLRDNPHDPKKPPKEHELLSLFINTECAFQAYAKLFDAPASKWWRVDSDGRRFDMGLTAIENGKKAMNALLDDSMVARALELKKGGSASTEIAELKTFIDKAFVMLNGTGKVDQDRRTNYFREQGQEFEKAFKQLAMVKAKDPSIQKVRNKQGIFKFLDPKYLFSPPVFMLLGVTKAIAPLFAAVCAFGLIQSGFGYATFISTSTVFNFGLAYLLLAKVGVSLDEVLHDWGRRGIIKWGVAFFNEKTSNPISRLNRGHPDAATAIEVFKTVVRNLVDYVYVDPAHAKRRQLLLEELERMEMTHKKSAALKDKNQNANYTVAYARVKAVMYGWDSDKLSAEERKAVREDYLYGCEPVSGNWECPLEKELANLKDNPIVTPLVTGTQALKNPIKAPLWALDLPNTLAESENFNLTEIILDKSFQLYDQALRQLNTDDYRLSIESMQQLPKIILDFASKMNFGTADAPNEAKQDSPFRHIIHLINPYFYHAWMRKGLKPT